MTPAATDPLERALAAYLVQFPGEPWPPMLQLGMLDPVVAASLLDGAVSRGKRLTWEEVEARWPPGVEL